MPEISPSPLDVRLPDVRAGSLDQDAEWCVVVDDDGAERRIRFHDYDEIFAIPGLYERLFYEELRCTSPLTVRRLIEHTLEDRGLAPDSLTVLDVGAGNGMVAEQLDDLGAGRLIGVDILTEAADAAERDRPGLYDDYLVMDLTDPQPEDDAQLREEPFTCLTSVAALGFGDMPPEAFAQALEYLEPGGLVAFTLRDRFVDEQEAGSFGALVRDLYEGGALEPIAERRYRHRLSVSGDPLHYVAYVAEKAA
jgi:predicted TPR repeat methyltransferase